MDYGTDFLLSDNDIAFTDEGDIEIVEGVACVAQDINQTLKLTLGQLEWDKDTGSTLPQMINDTEDEEAIIAELERVAIADPRVNPDTVVAKKLSDGNYRLIFTPLDSITSETLLFDLAEIGVE